LFSQLALAILFLTRVYYFSAVRCVGVCCSPEEVKPWVEDPAMKAEVTSMMSPNFGETREEMERQTRGEYIQQTPEEKAAEEAFWAPIDAEIKEEQQREAEARAQRS
jgi:hypothetical protein